MLPIKPDLHNTNEINKLPKVAIKTTETAVISIPLFKKS
jgi:hypothetical protein